MFNKIIEKAVINSFSNNQTNHTDYLGKDGLLYCGNCHSKKQSIININGIEYRPNCICTCRKKEIDDLDEKERQAQRKKDRINSIGELLRHNLINLNSRLSNASFENYIQTSENSDLLPIIKAYVESFTTKSEGLLLYGDVGTGKTYISALIANEIENKTRYTTCLTSLNRLITDLDNQAELTEQIAYVDLLILDDFGAERTTAYGLERAYEIINARYISEKPLIITTNKSMQDMLTATTIEYQRMFDRILEICLPINAKGKSFRKEIAKNNLKQQKLGEN